MRLFLLRHGIAEPASGDMADFDRPLTAEGHVELEVIARGLLRLRMRPDRILSSPLVRARQTAEIVGPVLGVTVELADELSSGALFDDFQRLLRRHSSTTSLLLVGHEPDFSDTAATLIGAHDGSLTLKKAGLIRIDLDSRAEPGRGRLRWLLTPGQLTLIGGLTEAMTDD
jgi:phosphohistidine phosphatase